MDDAIDIGTHVHVVTWHPSPPFAGSSGDWDIVTGRVVSIGKHTVVFEMDNPTLLFGGTVEPTPGSPLRFTTPDSVFLTHAAATACIATLPITGPV